MTALALATGGADEAPQSLDAERAVLGSVLVDRDAWDIVAAIVEPPMFYAHAHEAIMRVMADIAGRGQPLDHVTIGEALRARGQLDRVGGMAYLAEIRDVLPTASSAAYYATIVRDASRLRAVIAAGHALVRIGLAGHDDVDAAISTADEAATAALRYGMPASVGRDMPELLRRAHAQILAAGERNPTLRSPWPALDRLTGGAMPGETWLVAASPAIGKSAVAAQMADYVAEHYGQVAFFALEMGDDSTMRRFVATYSGVSARKLRSGELSNGEHESVASAMGDLHDRQLTMFDSRTSSLAAITRECRRLARRDGNLAAIVIDHANFIADVARHDPRQSKHAALDRVYSALALLAQELDAWLILVQHVNRAGMKLGIDGVLPEPSLSDIRDGGNIEGLAQVVLFPHRAHARDDDLALQAQGKIIVAKSRDGVTGSTPMHFDGGRHLWLEQYDDGSVQRPWFEAGR